MSSLRFARAKTGVSFLILIDSDGAPGAFEAGLFQAEMFEVVSNVIPTTWRISLERDEDAYVKLGPEPFLREGFFDQYWGEGESRAIVDEFDDEVRKILHEDEEEAGLQGR
jgi:hypothetical protein